MRSFIIYGLRQYDYNEELEDGMGRTCGTLGIEEDRVQGVGGKARRKETNRKT
jgi:hypothetical protein